MTLYNNNDCYFSSYKMIHLHVIYVILKIYTNE